MAYKHLIRKFLKIGSLGTAHIVVPVLALLLVTVAGVYMLVSTHADSRAPNRSYLVLFSERGTFSRAKITVYNTGGTNPDNSHICGGALTDSNSHTVTKSLSKNHGLRLSCSAVGGSSNGEYYKVTFLKTSKSTSGVEVDQVDTDGSAPVNCTKVGPDAAPVNSTGSCQTTGDTIHKHTVAISGCINSGNSCATTLTNVIIGRRLTGHITLNQVADWSGADASSLFCTGNVSVQYRQSDGTTVPKFGTFTARVRYQAATSSDPHAHCSASFSQTPQLNAGGTVYNLWAAYVGNSYVNPNPAQPSLPTLTYQQLSPGVSLTTK